MSTCTSDSVSARVTSLAVSAAMTSHPPWIKVRARFERRMASVSTSTTERTRLVVGLRRGLGARLSIRASDDDDGFG